MKNKVIRVIIIVVLSIVSFVGLYRGIGYLIRACMFPTITNVTINSEQIFFGYFVLSGVWFMVFILSGLANLIFALKTRKKKQEVVYE